MSNPWDSDKEEAFSGFGVEFVFETNTKSTVAIEIVQNLMAYNILLAYGKIGDFPMLVIKELTTKTGGQTS
jgi:hypothetical protein